MQPPIVLNDPVHLVITPPKDMNPSFDLFRVLALSLLHHLSSREHHRLQYYCQCTVFCFHFLQDRSVPKVVQEVKAGLPEVEDHWSCGASFERGPCGLCIGVERMNRVRRVRCRMSVNLRCGRCCTRRRSHTRRGSRAGRHEIQYVRGLLNGFLLS